MKQRIIEVKRSSGCINPVCPCQLLIDKKFCIKALLKAKRKGEELEARKKSLESLKAYFKDMGIKGDTDTLKAGLPLKNTKARLDLSKLKKVEYRVFDPVTKQLKSLKPVKTNRKRVTYEPLRDFEYIPVQSL